MALNTNSYKVRIDEKRLGGNLILKGLDLEFTSDKATVLIGPNGSGKSVLLQAMALIDPPDIGTIEVLGRTYTFPHSESSGAPSDRALWPELTLVFQQLHLWPHLTLRQNIELPLEARRGALAERSREMETLVRDFQLTGLLDRLPNQVSGGQRQRAALVRAFLLRPKWLLLDEPNSSLDAPQTIAVRDYLNQLKQRGIGLIFSTHLLGFASQVADRFVFLERGSITEAGDINDLFNARTSQLRDFVAIHSVASKRDQR